jgi:NADH-quinone oxidoreductase subunit E
MDESKIDKIINEHEGDASALIRVLQEIQHENHWLSIETLEKISQELSVPLSQVQHCATFFKSLNVVPEALHKIHICNGTSCHIRGAARIIDAVQEITGIKPGEIDPDLKFSVEAVTCIGRCSSGPAMIIDGKNIGKLDASLAEDIIKSFK